MATLELLARIAAVKAEIQRKSDLLAQLKDLSEKGVYPVKGYKVVVLSGGWDSPSINDYHRSSSDGRTEFAIVPDDCLADEGYGWDSKGPPMFRADDGGEWPILGDGYSPEEAWADAHERTFNQQVEG